MVDVLTSSIASGKIITFYSYKGGTGRSMVLANVAWILASNGKRVLTVDWDLEAPGLHRYFYPFLLDKNLTSSDGVIDFVTDFSMEAMSGQKNEGRDSDWYKPFANILRYAASLDWEFPKGGTLDFIPSGRQGQSYSERVNLFNWQNFYERLGGGAFIEAAKQKMREDYEYILIDSRTGVSDTSGICTVQMPDILAVCFTLNNQSIDGASAVAASVEAQCLGESGVPRVRVFPVPMRVEKFEKEKLEFAREAARNKFDRFLRHLRADQRATYWGEVETFYEPFYAYEEVLATFGDKPLQTNSMLASAERLTGYLTDGAVIQLEAPAEFDRQRILAQYERRQLKQQESPARPEPASRDVPEIFVSYAWGDNSSEEARQRTEVVNRLCETLEREGWRIIRDTNATRPGDMISAFMRSIRPADHVIVILSEKYLRSPYCMTELHALYQNSRQEKPEFLDRIILLVLDDARFGTLRERVEYAKYWEAEYLNLKADLDYLAEDDFRLYQNIKKWYVDVGNMLAYVNDVMVPHGFDDIVKEDFATLRQRLSVFRPMVTATARATVRPRLIPSKESILNLFREMLELARAERSIIVPWLEAAKKNRAHRAELRADLHYLACCGRRKFAEGQSQVIIRTGTL